MIESGKHIAQLFENICQRDDQKSFEELFKLFYEKLLNFCINYTKDKEAGEEIVSDVLLKIWVKRKELSHVQNLGTYVYIMVKNQSLNYAKQFSGYRVIYLEETGSHQLLNTHDPEKELERRELIFKMNEAIATLPQQCKVIFSLVKEEGLKYKEVAQILNISPRTVETQLVRAMQKLDKILSPYILSKETSPKRKSKKVALIKSILFSIHF
ncbi:MAG: RNA polymerase sigma-70 factor [Ginsengibacter sp.]